MPECSTLVTFGATDATLDWSRRLSNYQAPVGHEMRHATIVAADRNEIDEPMSDTLVFAAYDSIFSMKERCYDGTSGTGTQSRP